MPVVTRRALLAASLSVLSLLMAGAPAQESSRLSIPELVEGMDSRDPGRIKAALEQLETHAIRNWRVATPDASVRALLRDWKP